MIWPKIRVPTMSAVVDGKYRMATALCSTSCSCPPFRRGSFSISAAAAATACILDPSTSGFAVGATSIFARGAIASASCSRSLSAARRASSVRLPRASCRAASSSTMCPSKASINARTPGLLADRIAASPMATLVTAPASMRCTTQSAASACAARTSAETPPASQTHGSWPSFRKRLRSASCASCAAAQSGSRGRAQSGAPLGRSSGPNSGWSSKAHPAVVPSASAAHRRHLRELSHPNSSRVSPFCLISKVVEDVLAADRIATRSYNTS
mmetsp:Transcript_7779/g.17954  ORF Transcript_7779/g.17954 Transcript_7779/m.17954 type:complete len:270 (-) Transcript_7779:408-1217(-)